MGTHSNFNAVKSRFNVPAPTLAPPPLKQAGLLPPGSPRVPQKPFPYRQAPPTHTHMYPSHAPKPKPPPFKPGVGGISMEPRFKSPVPPGKLPGPPTPPSAGKPPAGSISTLKEALEKGSRDESKGPPSAPAFTPKPLGGKFPPADGEKEPKSAGTPFPKAPPTWKKPPLKEVSSQSPTPNDTGSTHNAGGSVQLQKKLFMGRMSESEPQKEISSRSPAPNDAGSTHNAGGSVQLQKKLFMGRMSESEPQKEISSRSPAPNDAGSTHNAGGSVQLQKKLFMGRMSESELQKEMSSRSPAPNDAGSTHNVGGSVQLQKKLFMGRMSESEPQKEISTRDSVSSAPNAPGSDQPQRKALPSLVSLGMCPAKPRRPSHVDLQPFRNHGSANSAPDDVFPPPPPFTAPQEGPPAPPPLPLRVVEEESYDDVGLINSGPSKPGHKDPEFEDEFDEDSETYEDIEDRWPGAESERASESKETSKSKKDKESKKQKKKMEKEEKERAEREKKEKKEMEKREQEARKRFKLKGPVEVVLKGSVRADCKGSKVDLELEGGERVEVVRTTGNPEGRWLARTSRGYYGYVRADLVDIEGSTQQPVSGDVYDDVAAPDQSDSFSKVCPPAAPEPEIADDIYDMVDEGDSDAGFPPPPLLPPPDFPAADGDTYDDVGPSSLASAAPTKTQDMDPKKKKKFEKEEKEFRKKFKYDQEILVLYEATVLPALVCKKFSGKDLVIRPGDVLSVITSPKDGRLICRNSEGKFGFVSVSNIQQDSDIYDDVGEDCVYDND